jgi:phosphate transport system substrate-binding protein
VIKNKLSALAGCALLAIGIAACGSSNSSSTTTTSTGSAAASKTATTPATGTGVVSGAGSTFAAPVYEQWGSTVGGGLKVNY